MKNFTFQTVIQGYILNMVILPRIPNTFHIKDRRRMTTVPLVSLILK